MIPGLYIHLGPLVAGWKDRNLAWAAELRDSGVQHIEFMNFPVGNASGAPGTGGVADAQAQLDALAALGMSVGVRPFPMIAEQLAGRYGYRTASPTGDVYTPIPLNADYAVRRSSIDAVRGLILHPRDTLYVTHEFHDFLATKGREEIVNGCVPQSVEFYGGTNGLRMKHGLSFGDEFRNELKEPKFAVHVACNMAAVGDASSPAVGVGPKDVTPRDIVRYVKAHKQLLQERGIALDQHHWHAHINITPETQGLVELLAAAMSFPWDVLQLRLVDASGNTLKDANGRHATTPEELAAIKKVAGWLS